AGARPRRRGSVARQPGPLPGPGGQLEPPRLDAVHPRRVHEAQVVVGLRGHEYTAVETVERRGAIELAVVEPVEAVEGLRSTAARRMLLVGQAADARDAVAIGLSPPDHGAVAVLHRHARAFHRRSAVERR